MTTIAYRDGIMASDGKITSGDRIDWLDLKKVRKINNCLIGGAGRLRSVFAFFDWFERWSDAQVVQGQAPHVDVFIPEGIDDEDFYGLVVFSDGTIFHYEGGKYSYEIPGEKYTSIGSGSYYALAALDAGVSAEEAVKIASGRDVFTGGQIFVEQLDIEPEDITLEEAQAMTKEELLALMFPKDDDQVVGELKGDELYADDYVSVGSDGIVRFTKEGETEELASIMLIESAKDEAPFKNLAKKLKRDYLESCLKLIYKNICTGQPEGPDSGYLINKETILDHILECMDEVYEEYKDAQK